MMGEDVASVPDMSVSLAGAKTVSVAMRVNLQQQPKEKSPVSVWLTGLDGWTPLGHAARARNGGRAGQPVPGRDSDFSRGEIENEPLRGREKFM